MSVECKMQRILNPATQDVIAEVAQASKADVEKIIQSARDAFDQGPWPRLSLPERKEFLLKIAQGILDNAQELAQIESQNTGKPIKEVTFMDIPSSAKTFEYFANNLERYLKTKEIALEASGKSELIYEPRGVVVLIVPWNYPLLIASWKIAQALAAGNAIILKPSSATPLSALKLAEIITRLDFPQGVVNVINASGSEVGEMLCSDSRVDMISFTGSTGVGKDIMRFASKGVKKVIMELGGKSASLILADCDLETAVMGSLTSIFLNQGQMCTAMSRLLVDKRIASDFTAMFVERAKKIKLGNGLDPQAQMGSLISRAQREKVSAYVEQGIKEGAKLLCGGKIPKTPELNNGFFFEPTVFSNVESKMSIFQEEIFGPVACISTFDSEEEAVALANSSSFGLASCVWSKDVEHAKQLARKINAGTVWINTYGMFHNEAPYGGFKQSGFGKELGQEGLLEYTRIKHMSYDSSQEKPLVSYWYAF